MNQQNETPAQAASQEMQDMYSWVQEMQEQPEDLRAILIKIGSMGSASTITGGQNNNYLEPINSETAEDLERMHSWLREIQEKPEDLKAILMEIGSLGTISTTERQMYMGLDSIRRNRSNMEETSTIREGDVVGQHTISVGSTITAKSVDTLEQEGAPTGSSEFVPSQTSEVSPTTEEARNLAFLEYIRSLNKSKLNQEAASADSSGPDSSQASSTEQGRLSFIDLYRILLSASSRSSNSESSMQSAPIMQRRDSGAALEEPMDQSAGGLRDMDSATKEKRFRQPSGGIDMKSRTQEPFQGAIREEGEDDVATPLGTIYVRTDRNRRSMDTTSMDGTSIYTTPSTSMDTTSTAATAMVCNPMKQPPQQPVASRVDAHVYSSDTSALSELSRPTPENNAINANWWRTKEEEAVLSSCYAFGNTLPSTPASELRPPTQESMLGQPSESSFEDEIISCDQEGVSTPLEEAFVVSVTENSLDSQAIQEGKRIKSSKPHNNANEQADNQRKSFRKPSSEHTQTTAASSSSAARPSSHLPQWLTRPYTEQEQSFHFDEQQEMLHTDSHNPGESRFFQWKRMIVIAMTVAVVALASVVVVFVVKQETGNDNNINNNGGGGSGSTSRGVGSLSVALQNLFAVLEISEALNDPTSYQSMALAWLLGNDNDLDSYSDAQQIQRWVLACVYYSTGGGQDAWTTTSTAHGWLSSDAECLWKGVSCDHDDNFFHNRKTITGLDMRDFGLIYEFPPEVQYLSSALERLDLRGNFLSNQGDNGHDFLKRLTNLRYLYLGSNEFGYSGVPSQLGQLSLLVELDVTSNFYNGPLRGEVFRNMPFLKKLQLGDGNTYNSSIPTEFGQLSSLQYLHLEDASITGGLNLFLERAATGTGLTEVWLDRNPTLGGNLPSVIGTLTTLTGVSMTGSNLSGGIPTELGLLSDSLRLVLLSTNQLQGGVPTELGLLSKLERLELVNNDLTGIMPLEVCLNTPHYQPAFFQEIKRSLQVLEADCVSEMECLCCTRCL